MADQHSRKQRNGSQYRPNREGLFLQATVHVACRPALIQWIRRSANSRVSEPSACEAVPGVVSDSGWTDGRGTVMSPWISLVAVEWERHGRTADAAYNLCSASCTALVQFSSKINRSKSLLRSNWHISLIMLCLFKDSTILVHRICSSCFHECLFHKRKKTFKV